jgi:hypothetical protein
MLPVHPQGATHFEPIYNNIIMVIIMVINNSNKKIPIGARPNDTLHSRLLLSVLSATLIFFLSFLLVLTLNDKGLPPNNNNN